MFSYVMWISKMNVSSEMKVDEYNSALHYYLKYHVRLNKDLSDKVIHFDSSDRVSSDNIKFILFMDWQGTRNVQGVY